MLIRCLGQRLLLAVAAMLLIGQVAGSEGYSAGSALELFEHELSSALAQAEPWPDLIVIERGPADGSESSAFAYLVLEVRDYASCQGLSEQGLKLEQLGLSDEFGGAGKDCRVTAVWRLESEAPLPLATGAHTRTHLVLVPSQAMLAWVSADDGLAWMLRQSPWPLHESLRQESEGLLAVAAELSSGDPSRIEWFEAKFALAGVMPAQALRPGQLLSEAFVHLTEGPLTVACDGTSGCTAGGLGAHGCSCSSSGNSCKAMCASGFACCRCQSPGLPLGRCCSD